MPSSPKTQPTTASVADFIAAQPEAQRRADCQAVLQLMQQATGEKAQMWGSSIVGFGRYRSNTGEWPVVGFSPRKNELTLYLMPAFEGRDELLARLGKHKTGKACVYLKRLADVDTAVLAELVQTSVEAMAPQRVRA
jgi:hypothetical protein